MVAIYLVPVQVHPFQQHSYNDKCFFLLNTSTREIEVKEYTCRGERVVTLKLIVSLTTSGRLEELKSVVILLKTQASYFICYGLAAIFQLPDESSSQ